MTEEKLHRWRIRDWSREIWLASGAVAVCLCVSYLFSVTSDPQGSVFELILFLVFAMSGLRLFRDAHRFGKYCEVEWDHDSFKYTNSRSTTFEGQWDSISVEQVDLVSFLLKFPDGERLRLKLRSLSPELQSVLKDKGNS